MSETIQKYVCVCVCVCVSCRWVSTRSPCAATERRRRSLRSWCSWRATRWITATLSQVLMVLLRSTRRDWTLLECLFCTEPLTLPPPPPPRQVCRAAGCFLTLWRKATWWCLRVTTSRTGCCGSRPCIEPPDSPTNRSRRRRTKTWTAEEESRNQRRPSVGSDSLWCVCWFVGFSAGWHKNNWTDSHRTWMEDGSRPRIDPNDFWFGSWLRHRSRTMWDGAL